MKTTRDGVLLLLMLFLLSESLLSQEMLVPLGAMSKDETILSKKDTTSIGFRGTGFFPVTQGEIEDVYYNKEDTLKQNYSWLRRKLHFHKFDEHFVSIKGDDYFFAIDPLFNVALGVERGIEENTLFQNTRAFQVTGEVMGKVSFFTSFHENQARFASYQTAFFDDRGERRYVEDSAYYDNIHPVIPAGGRTKPFKEDALDYSASASYIRYRPSDHFAVQFGNTPNFIGWGHRSMLLSDNSFNATTLRMDAKLSDKWSYTTLNSKHLNVYRRISKLDGVTFINMVEEPYEKKNYSGHYLSYQPTERLTLSFFEATVFFRDDSIYSQWMHPLYFNPIPGVNTAVFGWENEVAKSLLGLNFAWNVGKNHLIFGQFVTDQLGNRNEYGIQLGFRSRNLFNIKNLSIHGEFNKASQYLYAANNQRIAYTHYNFPLAHTLGNGFEELIGRLTYHHNNFYLQLQGVLYQSDQPIENQTHLFASKEKPSNIDKHTVLVNEAEVGYRFNTKTNLRLFTKVIYRMSEGESSGQRNTGLVFFGLKTGIFNQYTDF